MNTGWICPRCQASNAPSISKCSCSPVNTQPFTPTYPNSWPIQPTIDPWIQPGVVDPWSPWDWINNPRPYRVTWSDQTTDNKLELINPNLNIDKIDFL